MYHIAVVDDEPQTRIDLTAYIERFAVERGIEIDLQCLLRADPGGDPLSELARVAAQSGGGPAL